MFNNRILATITLNKKKLKKSEKESCLIECIPTINLLTKTECDELIECLNKATEILRSSYIRAMKKYD